MTHIRFVRAEEWGTLEGKVQDMPWLVAKERFMTAFRDPQRGLGVYERVEEAHGCRASNAKDWAIGMNSVIHILNSLPENPTEAEVLNAFAL
jgi:hypothetical protein